MDIINIDKRLANIKKGKQSIRNKIQLEKNQIEIILSEVENNKGYNALKSISVDHEANKTNDTESYLKYREKVSDINYFSKVKKLLEDIPESNGSRYFHKFDLNVGIIADEFLYQSYKDVANFHYITPKNYEDYKGKLDLFFVATTWRGLEKEWRGVANPDGKLRKELYKIIDFFKEQQVKVVFYSKEDPVNYEKFVDIATKCDFIFTTAQEKVEDYKKYCKNDKVYVLEFGINPIYHNPIGLRNAPKFDDVFFAGSWLNKYPDRQKETIDLFDGVINAGRNLKIIDRNFSLNHPDYFFPQKYLKYISPAIEHQYLQKIHKLYDWGLNLNSVKFSSTMFANRIYELQAIGNIILSNYSVGVNDKFPNVFIINDSQEIKDIMNGFTKEEIYNHQVLGIRNVMSSHTTFDRFDYLLECIGEERRLDPKKVLVVADVIDEHVKMCFDKQTYEHKTLILEKNLTEEIKSQYTMVAFFNSNYHYREYYLEDMVNGFKYTDSDFITKDGYYNGTEIVSGIEHNYISRVDNKYKTVYWSESFTANELLNMDNGAEIKNGYSIDHFEFNVSREIKKDFLNEKYEVSVIIPVYNNGKYLLNKCFNSLKRSSIFNKMEIIMIDDGSTDPKTIATINRIVEEHTNVKSYFYTDGGSGSASRPRNKGVELSTTGYITYLDPDNEAVNDGYAHLLEVLKKDESLDMVIGNMTKLDNVKKGAFNYSKIVTNTVGGKVIDNPRQLLIDTNLRAQSIQALLVKKEIITENQLKMVENAGGQDTLFFQELLLNSKRTSVINKVVHIYYAAVTGSVTNTITKKFFTKFHTIELERFPFLVKNELLDVYMDNRFNFYFKNWYLKRINKISKEDQKESIDTLYKIYSLYKQYITTRDKDIEEFARLYEKQMYEQIVTYFSKI
ncbi:glycosyltransferase [Mesobacillus maritimus]|uniref:glycosyltransferase n=1 Tax=Mesobacillus maritimus TaxID=1643336 RepID=UPI0038516735